MSSSSPTSLHQSTLRRISRSEDNSPFPIPGLPADILHMRVKEGSKIRNLLQFATARMQDEKGDGRMALRQVVFTGSGRGVTKTITCVEILKRKIRGLHQVSKLCYKTVREIWESPQHGEAGVTVHRTVPAICILLSKDPLDPQEPGYQPPKSSLNFSTEDTETDRDKTDYSHSPRHNAKRLCLHDRAVTST
ncbi:ribonuclease P protein subunit p25-like protein [Genypterus blacodes]|uniref:ribonuclease P protein subunit p25-like protein n=1 Tax=Genypterus blacodes TaxID=154954 RepID=UPI003F774B2B